MRVDKLIPEVYYKESRDFSYIGRLFEILFNYMKMQADLVNKDVDNENVNADILELAAKTVGFETKHKYINKDLVYVINNFIPIVRKKGTLDSIISACIILATSQGVELKQLESRVSISETSPQTILIRLPSKIKDLIILEDMLNYILPAGWLYQIEAVENAPEELTEDVLLIDDSNVSIPEPVSENSESKVTDSDVKNSWARGVIITDNTL